MKKMIFLRYSIDFFFRFLYNQDSFYGPLAQLVEQQTLNLWVAGSKPAWLKFV